MAPLILQFYCSVILTVIFITPVIHCWPQNAEVFDGDSFEYIVVGAGSAGAVVANRLAEDFSVLLIEAGGDPPRASVYPGLLGELPNTEYDWNYTTVKDDNLMKGQKDPGVLKYTRGKMLGGCSSLNFMYYVRGYPDDFNRLADLNLKGWDWDSVFPYFLKSEGLQDESILNDPELKQFHNSEGLMKVSREVNHTQQVSVKLNIIMESLEEIGIPKIKDYNDPQKLGTTFTFVTHADGIRYSTAEAFLKKYKKSNLKVLKHALASKILFDSNNAQGVEVVLDSTIIKLYASKEVIISAGAINTPKLLIQSGIGEKEEVERIGEELIAELPVGGNLQDQIIIPLMFTGGKTKNETIPESVLLSNLVLTSLNGFFNLNDTAAPQFQILPVYFNQTSPTLGPALLSAFCGYSERITNSVVKQNQDNEVFAFLLLLLHPKSTGKVSVKSNKYIEDPEIKLNYLSDPDDLATLKKGAKKLLNFVNTTYLKSVNSVVVKPDLPDCEEYEFLSDSYLECYISTLMITSYHPVGTCAMGQVVDEDLKVINVNNLRVVDASVLPHEPSGNPNAPIIMLAEKIADVIKGKI